MVVFDVPAQTKVTSPEYQVKAVFLFNFTQFVEWPDKILSTDNEPLIIGILGDDPFGAFLDETIKGETVNGHPLTVQRFTKIDQLTTCHVLFICQTEKKQLKDILLSVEHKNILTVSDINNFAKQGGIIRFVTENNKTRLRINLEAAKKEGLTISSKLLRLAEIVATTN